jgi:tRNA(adenine34) deaminase
MEEALAEARLAFDRDEVPVGALVVHPSGRIIGRGSNNVEHSHSVIEHAELCAISDAGKHLSQWRLDECALFVTLEPCLMCAGAIVASRLSTLIFGTHEPLTGAFGSRLSLLDLLPSLSLRVIEGVGGKESAMLLKEFFSRRR